MSEEDTAAKGAPVVEYGDDTEEMLEAFLSGRCTRFVVRGQRGENAATNHEPSGTGKRKADAMATAAVDAATEHAWREDETLVLLNLIVQCRSIDDDEPCGLNTTNWVQVCRSMQQKFKACKELTPESCKARWRDMKAKDAAWKIVEQMHDSAYRVNEPKPTSFNWDVVWRMKIPRVVDALTHFVDRKVWTFSDAMKDVVKTIHAQRAANGEAREVVVDSMIERQHAMYHLTPLVRATYAENSERTENKDVRGGIFDAVTERRAMVNSAARDAMARMAAATTYGQNNRSEEAREDEKKPAGDRSADHTDDDDDEADGDDDDPCKWEHSAHQLDMLCIGPLTGTTCMNEDWQREQVYRDILGIASERRSFKYYAGHFLGCVVDTLRKLTVGRNEAVALDTRGISTEETGGHPRCAFGNDIGFSACAYYDRLGPKDGTMYVVELKVALIVFKAADKRRIVYRPQLEFTPPIPAHELVYLITHDPAMRQKALSSQ